MADKKKAKHAEVSEVDTGDPEIVEVSEADMGEPEIVEVSEADTGEPEIVEVSEADTGEPEIVEVSETDAADVAAMEISEAEIGDAKAAEPGDVGAGDSKPPEVVEPERPRGKTSLATMLLIGFNLLAALGFGYLLHLDSNKRLNWARAILMRDLAVQGVPLDDSPIGTNPEAGMQPKHDLDPPLLKEAFATRGMKPSDKFQAVTENFKALISSENLDDNTLSKYFSEAGVPRPVATRKKEIDYLKANLPEQIKEIAQGVVSKMKGKEPKELRDLARKILFPLCTEGWQAVKLNDKIENTPDPELGAFLAKAAKRRLWFDILQPLEVFRPSENPDPKKIARDPKIKKSLVDRAADLDDVSVEDLRKLWDKRCDQVLADMDWIVVDQVPTLKRNTFEKRRSSTFLLLAASQPEVPGSDRVEQKLPEQPKQPKGPDAEQGEKKEPDQQPKVEKKRPPRTFAFPDAEKRAKVVCGLFDFNQACEDLAIVNEILEKQTVLAINRDLGNYCYPLGARVIDPKKFADQLVGMIQKFEVQVPNSKLPEFKTAIVIADEQALRNAIEDKLKQLQGKFEDMAVLEKELKDIIGTQVQILEDPESPGSKSVQTALDRGLNALLSSNAIGFLGQHQAAISRIQALALLCDKRESEYKKLDETYKEIDSLQKTREAYAKQAQEKLLEQRVVTRQLARELKELQDELFVAQVNLAGAHAYNLYLAERQRAMEQKAKSKGGAGQ